MVQSGIEPGRRHRTTRYIITEWNPLGNIQSEERQDARLPVLFNPQYRLLFSTTEQAICAPTYLVSAYFTRIH